MALTFGDAMKKLSSSLGFALLVLVLVACKKGQGGHCYVNKDCKDDLVCSSDKHECATLEGADAICSGSSDCKAFGHCHATHTVGAEVSVLCVAKAEEDCKQADCAKRGCKYAAAGQNCQ